MKKGWREVALAEVLRREARPVEVIADQTYREIGIRSHGKGIFHKEPLSGLSLGDKRVFWLKPGDFVLNIVFAWEGAVGVIGQDEVGMIGSHRFPTFHADDSCINLRFLVAYFRTRDGLDLLGRVSPGGAGRNRTLSQTAFLNQRIPLPPLAEQQRIVAHLDAIESRLTRAQKLREEQEKELLAALRSTFHQLEAKAEWVELRKVAPVHRRQIEIRPEGKYPELGARSFGRGIFHKPTVRGDSLTWQKLFQVRAGDIVISNIKAWEGALAVAGEADDGRYGSHRYLTCVADTQCVLPEYVCFYLLSPSGLEQVGLASPGSADRNRTLAVERLEMIKIPIVPLATQREFKKLLDLQATVRAEAALSNQRLEALLPSLLDRLFNN